MRFLKIFIKAILNGFFKQKEAIVYIFLKNIKFNNFKEVTLIPLGATCQLAHNLKYFNLLKTNYGLEWINTQSITTITKLFENDFKPFFSEKNIVIKNGNSIHDKFYETRTLHDSFFISKENHIDIKFFQKYERRLGRFKTAFHQKKKIIFIRQLPHKTSLSLQIFHETRDCINTLKKYYPQVKFDFFLIYTNTTLKAEFINEFHAIRYKKLMYFKKSKIDIKIYQTICKWYQLNHGWKGGKIAWLRILNTINKRLT